MIMLATYGTLRKDGGNYIHFNLKSRARHIGKGKVTGYNLYDLGGYPGAFQSPDKPKKIVVDVFSIPDIVLRREIDRMEERAGYRIQKVIVVLDDGSILKADMYIYNAAGIYGSIRKAIQELDAYEIDDGDWMEYVYNYKTFG